VASARPCRGSAYVRLLPSGRFQALYTDRSGKTQSAGTFVNRKDAENAARRKLDNVADGTWLDPRRSRVTVGELASDWLPTKFDLRPSSRARLEGVVKTHVLPRFGDVPLPEITNSAVRAWVAKMLASGSSPATVRKAHNALAQMLRAAVADRRLAFNPAQDVPLPSAEAEEQRFLTADEVNDLADVIEPRFRALVLVAAYGGLRFGELSGLRRRRVDVLRGRVTVAETLSDVGGVLSTGQPKTKRSRRTVPLPRSIVREVDAHLSQYTAPNADAFVFTGPTGVLLRRSAFRRYWWQPAVAAVSLEDLRFHDLRHSFVALWVAAGANVKEVSVRAGHSSVAFTLDRYGHLYEDRSEAPWRSASTTFSKRGNESNQKSAND
jgi:integrase